MAIIYNHLRRLLILCFAFFYILNYFVKSPELGIIVSVLIILVVSQNFLALPKTNLRVCATLILLGSLILIWKGASLQLWLAAAAKNAGLVTLFISVPLMGLPFFYENYQEELKHVAQRYMTNVWSFCLLTAVTVHMLGVIISVGAVALVYELFKENARLYKADKLFYAALLQGYMTTGYWSPAWASMAVVTQDLKLPWLSFVPVGIVLTIISLVLSLIHI